MYNHHRDGRRVQGGYQHDLTWSLQNSRVRALKSQPNSLLRGPQASYIRPGYQRPVTKGCYTALSVFIIALRAFS